MFYANHFTCRCISLDMFVGEGECHVLLLHHFDPSPLLINFQCDLSIVENRVFKSIIIKLISFSLFSVVNLCSICLNPPILCCSLLINWPLYHYKMTSFFFCYCFYLKSIFVSYICSYSFCEESFSHPFIFSLLVCCLKLEWVSFKQHIVRYIFLSIHPPPLSIKEFSTFIFKSNYW